MQSRAVLPGFSFWSPIYYPHYADGLSYIIDNKGNKNGNNEEENTMITEDTIDLSTLNLDDFDDDN